MDLALSRAARVLTWNERVLKTVGVWPCKVNDILFTPIALYLTMQIYLAASGFFGPIGGTDIMEIIMELDIWFIVLFKLSVYRINRSMLKDLIGEVRDDYKPDNYESAEQLSEYLRYNRISGLFVKAALCGTVIPALLYYLKPLIAPVIVGQAIFPRNMTMSSRLPYRIYLPSELTEMRTFVMVYLYQGLVLPMILAGFTGTDCFFITLTLHICGQYAAIARQIKESINNSAIDHPTFHRWILKHQRLARISQNVNDTFNAILLYEFVSGTSVFIFVCYNMILNFKQGHYVTMLTFALVQNASLLSLFGYCFIGECLIHESTSISRQLYFSNWHEVPQTYKKYITFCMLRSEQPVELTACKLITFSCATFTKIVKTSGAYISFLQQVL